MTDNLATSVAGFAITPKDAPPAIYARREISGGTDVRLANEREFERPYPDCEVGAMPPLGPLYGQPVFVDRSLGSGTDIVFDGGSHRNAIKNEVRRLCTNRAATWRRLWKVKSITDRDVTSERSTEKSQTRA